MTTTPHSTLKLMLAKKLPEQLTIVNETEQAGIKPFVIWNCNSLEVLDTEWDYIVRLVEEQMTDEQANDYIDALRTYFLAMNEHLNFLLWLVKSCTWPDRAEAMKQIGFLKE